jgi:Na+-driven multidrug efflux pump
MIGVAKRIQWLLGAAVLALSVAGTIACSRAAGEGQDEALGTAGAASQGSPEVLVYKAPT